MLNQDEALAASPHDPETARPHASLHWAIATENGTTAKAQSGAYLSSTWMSGRRPVAMPQGLQIACIGAGVAAFGLLIALTTIAFVNNGAIAHTVADSQQDIQIGLCAAGALISGFFIFAAAPGLFLPTGLVFGLAAAFTWDPLIAAWMMVLVATASGLLGYRRNIVLIFPSIAITMLSGLLAGLTFTSLGGSPIIGNLTVNAALQILAAFLVFVVVNAVLWQGTTRLLGEEQPIGGQKVILAFLAMLPVSVVLAALAAQAEPTIFGLFSLVVVVAGILLQRNSKTEYKLREQLDRVRDLNELLEQQNEYQNTLGTRINTTLDDFLTLVRDYASTSHEQEAAVIEITATVEQLSRTASQIAGSADQVAEAAEMALTSADRGQAAVNDAIASINEVRAKVVEIAARISELDTKADRINGIISLINEIADEIRMLALNATIEASGAGPYGKRFGVVANEVNALADRSRRAVTEIGHIIAEIQQATTASVSATEQGLQRMERSVALASQTDDANREIISVVEHTAQAAAAISLATQQQRSASEQVVMSMHDVTRMIGMNTDKIARVSVASLDLQRVARDLRAENQA